MPESTDRTMREILHAVSTEIHPNGRDVEEQEPPHHDDEPLANSIATGTGDVPPLGQQAADAVLKATNVSAEDLERAAAMMRYAGKKIAGDIEMFTSLALLVSTKTRAVTER